jgi:tetratricopeptide (TPR) repeat protein
MKEKIIAALLILLVFNIDAQDSEYPYPSLSPKGNISQIVGNTTVEIEYERPSVRKRQIFGDLVPWNKVWRTGAGSCTKISFDKAVKFGGQKIEAGKYSLFTIPKPTEWIVILNKDTTLYGSYDYDYKKDMARFVTIPVESNRFYETLNFDIEILPNNAKIYLSWANVQVSIDVETTTDSDIQKLIEGELLTEKNKDSDIYAGAAEYLFFQGTNLMDAITLANTAIELNEHNGWARSLKIKIYEKMNSFDMALAEIENYTKYARSRKWNDEMEKKNTLNFLKKEYLRINSLKE